MSEYVAKLLVDIPEDLHKRIKHQAIDEDISVKDLVTKILDKHIKGKSNDSDDILGKNFKI